MTPKDLPFFDLMSIVIIVTVLIYSVGYFLASILLSLEKRFPGTILRLFLTVIGIISLNGAWVIYDHFYG